VLSPCGFEEVVRRRRGLRPRILEEAVLAEAGINPVRLVVVRGRASGGAKS